MRPTSPSSNRHPVFRRFVCDGADEPKKKDPAVPPASKPAGVPPSPVPTSFAPVVPSEDFKTTLERMKAEKPAIEKKHSDLLALRYDLRDDPAPGVTMARKKPVQQGVRVRLPKGVTWDQLAEMTPEQIREKDVWPAGFFPLPHPNHPEGGMLFPKFEIDELKKQEQRDLTRFDLDFDLPDHLLPEFPAPIFLTTRPDLGDVSKGKRVTIDNFMELFDGILNPKQLDGSAAAAHAVSAAAVQHDQRSPLRETASRASPASIAIPTATPMARRISSATSARRSIGIASTRRACAA